MNIRQLLVRLCWVLNIQFGIDPRKFFRSLKGLPRFARNLYQFKLSYKGRLELVPCLHDRYEEGGSTKNEYFWQDLLVAQRIFKQKPLRHVDVGSRIDGFVAHVASFRPVEVFDIRPVNSDIPGVVFKQADLMSVDSVAALCAGNAGYCDSLSCLHAIEHFGLGRYGDPVDPSGYRRGIENLSKLLQPGGRFYLSTPIGSQRVEFNANWVFDPNTILDVANAAGLHLDELTVLDQQGGHETVLSPTLEKLNALAHKHYLLGIFHFLKAG